MGILHTFWILIFPGYNLSNYLLSSSLCLAFISCCVCVHVVCVSVSAKECNISMNWIYQSLPCNLSFSASFNRNSLNGQNDVLLHFLLKVSELCYSLLDLLIYIQLIFAHCLEINMPQPSIQQRKVEKVNQLEGYLKKLSSTWCSGEEWCKCEGDWDMQIMDQNHRWGKNNSLAAVFQKSSLSGWALIEMFIDRFAELMWDINPWNQETQSIPNRRDKGNSQAKREGRRREGAVAMRRKAASQEHKLWSEDSGAPFLHYEGRNGLSLQQKCLL